MLAPERNARVPRVHASTGFARVDFADQATGRVYLSMASGRVVRVDREALAIATASPDTRAGLAAVAPGALDAGPPDPGPATTLRADDRAERVNTLGAWGWAAR